MAYENFKEFNSEAIYRVPKNLQSVLHISQNFRNIFGVSVNFIELNLDDLLIDRKR